MSMTSKISHSAKKAGKSVKKFYDDRSVNQKAMIKVVAFSLLMISPEMAFAMGSSGSGGGFFCVVAQYVKGIVAGAATLAICLWAIEHIFKVSKIHDIVMSVGIACAIVIGAATLISQTGLSNGCTLT